MFATRRVSDGPGKKSSRCSGGEFSQRAWDTGRRPGISAHLDEDLTQVTKGPRKASLDPAGGCVGGEPRPGCSPGDTFWVT